MHELSLNSSMENTKFNVLIIGWVWPEPDSSAAGKRMMDLILLFLKKGYQISFASTAARNDFSVNLKKLGVHELKIKLNDEGFNTIIGEMKPDIVVFDRFMTEEQFGWRVAEYSPESLRILDTTDLHCLRHARHMALKENSAFENKYLHNEYAYREIAAILRSDLSLLISQHELSLLMDFFNIQEHLIYYLPFLMETLDAGKTEKLPKYDERMHFCFIGNMRHAPNADATTYLKKVIWPAIKEKLKNAELHVYGAYMPEYIKQFHKPNEGFHIKGRADSVTKMMQNYRVLLAPLQFGAGLKGKLVDAMENGLPSVTTAIGAEGIHNGLPWNGFVEDTPATIVNRAIDLYNSEAVWETSQKNGYNIINTRFKQCFGDEFIDKLELLCTQRETHRKKNFYSKLLYFHQFNSTKYMGKWIEAKNKT